MTTPTTVLVHLCGLLDSEDTDPVVRKLAQDIVVEGVVVFFPDAKTRREYLLSMINTILVRYGVGVSLMRTLLVVGVALMRPGGHVKGVGGLVGVACICGGVVYVFWGVA